MAASDTRYVRLQRRLKRRLCGNRHFRFCDIYVLSPRQFISESVQLQIFNEIECTPFDCLRKSPPNQNAPFQSGYCYSFCQVSELFTNFQGQTNYWLNLCCFNEENKDSLQTDSCAELQERMRNIWWCVNFCMASEIWFENRCDISSCIMKWWACSRFITSFETFELLCYASRMTRRPVAGKNHRTHVFQFDPT